MLDLAEKMDKSNENENAAKPPATRMQYYQHAVKHYFSKWTGEYKAGPGKLSTARFVTVTAIGGFVALGVVSLITELAINSNSDEWLVMVGSYGATMVLVFGAPAGPFSQPRNVIIGNVFASLIGVGCRVWIADPMGDYSFALPFSVALSYVVMQITRTVNPPAGGTAAIAVIGSPDINKVGWALVFPAFLWGVIFVLVACIFINLIPGHRYPRYWFVDHQVYRDIQTKCSNCRCQNCGGESANVGSGESPAPNNEDAREESAPRPSSSPDVPYGMGQGLHQPLNSSVQNRDNEGNVIGDEEDEENEVSPDGHVKSLILESQMEDASNNSLAMV